MILRKRNNSMITMKVNKYLKKIKIINKQHDIFTKQNTINNTIKIQLTINILQTT